MTDKNDVVIGIAASLYASRGTDDALRAEPNLEALANEAWDLYFKLQRAVSEAHGEAAARANPEELHVGRAERKE
jgi:hypothetical protein